jgi:hypothetical protein
MANDVTIGIKIDGSQARQGARVVDKSFDDVRRSGSGTTADYTRARLTIHRKSEVSRPPLGRPGGGFLLPGPG